MANRGRVQINDLGAPDKLAVAPVQSDTFARPPQPVEDHGLQQLADSLGFFNKNLMAYAKAENADWKKIKTDEALADYNHWRAATSNTEVLDAMRSGKTAWTADPYIGKVVRADHAHLEAESLSAQIDADTAAGKIPWGDPNFNPEAYLIDKARPMIDRMGNTGDMMVPFRKHLDTIKGGMIQRQQEALGKYNQMVVEDVARRTFDSAFSQGAMAGLDGPNLSEAIRSIYHEVGPRLKGGSLDLKYSRLDDLVIDVLEQKAKDPAFAAQALRVLHAPRASLDGSAGRMGSLADISRHADKIEKIQDTATKTLTKAAEESVKRQALGSDVEALQRSDGSFSTIGDLNVPNPIDNSKNIHISHDERRKAAVDAFINRSRIALGGQPPDINKELDVVINNDVKHPEFVPFLDSTVAGVANTNIRPGDSPAPDQIARIQEAAQLYNNIADRNFAYTQKHLNKHTVDYFEGYTALIRYGGQTPVQAATSLARAYSNRDAQKDPHIEARRMQDIEQKVSSLDYSWLPFAGGISNKGDVQRQMVRFADTIAQTTGMDADTAIKYARDRIQKSAAYVNGRAIFGVPGFTAEDVPHVQPILKDFFDKNSPMLKDQGISSSSGLSIAPYRNGEFNIVDATTGLPIMSPVYGDKTHPDVPTGLARPTIKLSDIQKLKTVQDKAAKDEVAKNIINGRPGTANPAFDPYRMDGAPLWPSPSK